MILPWHNKMGETATAWTHRARGSLRAPFLVAGRGKEGNEHGRMAQTAAEAKPGTAGLLYRGSPGCRIPVQVIGVEHHMPQQNQAGGHRLNDPLQACRSPLQRTPHNQPQHSEKDQDAVHGKIDLIVACRQAGPRPKQNPGNIKQLRGENNPTDNL